MPKSKKKKKQDFQKVKLKVGKKLPKGDNVTNLSFKTRQIHLTQRIKDDDGQGLITKKKLSAQDLLRQCDHHSSSARVNAVAGLKELWLNNQTELMIPTNAHGYGEILKKLATLLIDNEAVVRHSVINLFKVILNRIGPKSTKDDTTDKLGGSLYSHIHAYLCCAMNHVHEDIKLDALILFDLLLDSFPHLMVQQTGDLLKNLIGLISSPSYLASKADATTQRLSLNPDSKLPAMKFRARVLLRMKRTFMEAIDDETSNHLSLENAITNQGERCWSLFADHCGPNTIQNTYLRTDSVGNRFKKMFLGGCHELDDYITKPASLQSFLKLSVPVLLQCWKEAQASIDAYSCSDNLVSADSVEVMSLVACIIQLMFTLCAKLHRGCSSYCASEVSEASELSPEFLAQNYQQAFEKLFMGHFPYTAQIPVPTGRKRKRHKGSQAIDNNTLQASLVALNLAVCDIMSSFCCGLTHRPSQASLRKLDSYTVRLLQKSPSLEQSKIIIRVLRNVFSNPDAAGGLSQGYKAALEHYLTCSSSAPQKQQFYTLFASMGQAWDGWQREGEPQQTRHLYQNDSHISAVLEKFFADLPHLLLNVVKAGGEKSWILQILTLMSHGHVMNCSQAFRTSFLMSLSDLLDPVSGVVACDDELIQQRLCFILSPGLPQTEDHLKQLLYVMRRPVEKPVLKTRRSWSVVQHAICSITSSIKSDPLENQDEFKKMTSQGQIQVSDYLRFIFSLQLGMTDEELDVFSPPEHKENESKKKLNVDFTVQSDQWDRHVEIANLVARELLSLHIPAMSSEGYHHTPIFLSNLENLWKQALTNRPKVHILAAYSLIQLFYQTSLPHVLEKPSQNLYSLVSQVVASVLIELFSPDNPGLASSEKMVWQIKSDIIQCLQGDSTLLNLVMALLTQQLEKFCATEGERQGSKTAANFLLSDETVKLKMASSL